MTSVFEYLLRANSNPNSAAARLASAEGRIDVLDSLKEYGLRFSSVLLYEAMSHGRVGVVRYILDTDPSIRVFVSDVCKAAEGGFTDVLKCLLDEKGHREAVLSTDVWRAAASGGHVHTLKWLGARRCPFKPSCVSAAVSNVHLDAVVFLLEGGYGCRPTAVSRKKAVVSTECFRRAARAESSGVLATLIRFDPPSHMLTWAELWSVAKGESAVLITKHVWDRFPSNRSALVIGNIKDGSLELVEYTLRLVGSERPCNPGDELAAAILSGSLAVMRAVQRSRPTPPSGFFVGALLCTFKLPANLRLGMLRHVLRHLDGRVDGYLATSRMPRVFVREIARALWCNVRQASSPQHMPPATRAYHGGCGWGVGGGIFPLHARYIAHRRSRPEIWYSGGARTRGDREWRLSVS